jgi:hypothetical protein
VIYANKPKAEYEGQAYLERILDSAGIQPDVLIHRGHSYYASKTIEKIKPSAKLFVLGSCGGYHNLSGVIQRAPEAHIVSSKQIGVQGVNNPMLKRHCRCCTVRAETLSGHKFGQTSISN